MPIPPTAGREPDHTVPQSRMDRGSPVPVMVSFRLCTLVAAALFSVVSVAKAGPSLVFDARTGEVLSETQAFDPWYPASLTKLMTAYVTFRAIAGRQIDLESPVVMTANAAKEPPSKMGFKPGTVVTVDTALKMLIVKSANDIAVALAETVGGSEAAFVERMNAEARRLGMAGTRFANPNGLPDEAQWTTARDYALLTRALIREYPQYAPLFRITALSLGSKVIKTHNHLLERYPGTDGMKTGFICSSGFNVVASATRGGRRLVAVVFGEANARVRAEKAARLLEEGFAKGGGGLFARRDTIESLRPKVSPPARPVDLRPTVCGKKPKGEDADDAGVASASAGGLPGAPKSYLVPPFKLMDPVPIALGATIKAPDLPSAPAGAATTLPPLPPPNPKRTLAAADAPTAPAPASTELGTAAGALGNLPPPANPPIEILGLRPADG